MDYNRNIAWDNNILWGFYISFGFNKWCFL